MMPTLQADEGLREVTRTAIGTGSVKEADGRRIMSDWNQRAGLAPKPAKPTTANLAAMGIGVRTVPKPSPA